MSTYKGKTYDTKAYLSHRPTYPASLYNYLRGYIGLPENEKVTSAVDVGCGSGQATIALAQTVAQKITGLDMSATMLDQGKVKLQEASENEPDLLKQVTFVVGDDRSLTSKFDPHSLDLVTVAEAAHWFKYPEFWESCHTVLKPGGTLAIWSYYLFSFEGYPESAEVIQEFSLGKHKCGPYWDEGQSRLNTLYDELHPPQDLFANEIRIRSELNDFDHKGPFELRRNDVPVEDMIALLRTYSGYHNWKKAHPNEPDLVEETVKELFNRTGLRPDSKVNVKWNTVIICMKSK